MKSHCYFIGTTLSDNPVPHHFMALSEELVRRGHRVVLVAPHRNAGAEDHSSNPAIYTWPSARPTRWCDARFLYRLVREHRPTCMVANFVSVNIMTLVGWLTRVPARIAWYHTLSAQIDLDSGLPGWRMRLLRWRKNLVYRANTHLVPVSHAALNDIRRVFRESARKATVFLNALADPLPVLGAATRVKSTSHLVCVARLFPSKGQDVLIRAVALLKDRWPQLSVEFIGLGPARENFEQLARDLNVSDRCTFAGNVPHTEVLDRMRAAAVTVLPSRSDNCPLVTIESLAVGTPLVASAVGGIPEVVRDGVDGYLVPPDDPERLAARLNMLLADQELHQQMSRQAREGFLSRFEQRRAVQEQADWLEQIAGRNA